MKEFEKQIIFSQKFPNASPAAMLDEAERLYQATPEAERMAIPSCEEMLQRFKEGFAYKLRPDAEEKSKKFIADAIWVCREFEIDTEIVRHEHEISVDMDIYFSWYGGQIKHALEGLLVLSDDVTLSSNKDKPDCICVSMTYHTHDYFYCGKRLERSR